MALRLDVDQLHVGERESPQNPFVDIGHLRVKVSWTSIFRFAPVVGEVVIERPADTCRSRVRSSASTFPICSRARRGRKNRSQPRPARRDAIRGFEYSTARWRSDIRRSAARQHHKIEKIQINVPFIANLPSDVHVSVEPLLQMVIHGSPFRIAGVAKPFGTTHDSVVDLKLHRLDLPLYVSYAPMKLPVKIPEWNAVGERLRAFRAG